MKRKKRSGSSDTDLKPTPTTDQELTTESDSKLKLGRRGFMKLGAGAAAVSLANPLESIAQNRKNAPRAVAPPKVRGAPVPGECGDVLFREPTPVTADGKILTTTLTAQKLDFLYNCNGTTAEGWQPVFNGDLPGPTLYLDQPGSTMNITLNNHLNEMPPFSADNCPGGHHGDPTQPACFQHTNLHFHGLQVSPCSLIKDPKTGQPVRQCGPYAINGTNPPLISSSDDVLKDIYPQQSNFYQVVLPDMHAPGTNWYHSHLHGASAYQVSGGMAGAIIIREPPGPARIVPQELDKVFLLQEVLVNPPPSVQPWPAFPPIYGGLPTGQQAPPPTTFFVNGRCTPTFQARKGQLMRWRFINAGVTPGALMTLKVVKTQTCSSTAPNPVPQGEIMWLMAMDGLSFYGIPPQPVRFHLLALGSRADFLMRFDTPGFYTLYKDGYPLASVNNPSSTAYTNATGTPSVLMYINVQDSSDPPDKIPDIIPGTKPAYLNPIWRIEPPDTVRDKPVRFQNFRVPNPPTPPNPPLSKFQIDGAPYNLNDPGIEVPLNTAQEWTLTNEVSVTPGAPPPGQSNTHPFHVHLNPFQIDGVNFDFEVSDADLALFKRTRMPNNPCNWPFWDTIALPGDASSPPKTTTLKIRSRFLIYDGEYVTHCHILLHEDVGMMINVKLIGDGVGPSTPVTTYPKAAADCIARTSSCPGDTKVQ